MKKISILICTLAIAFNTVAQQPKLSHEASYAPKVLSHNTQQFVSHPQITADQYRGGDFFYEDFSNGLDGSTVYGAWTVSDNADNTTWHIATDSGPEGQYTGDADGLDSETEDNGWMIWDGDKFIADNQTWLDTQGAFLTSFLTSPEINMSDLETVLVDYYQTFIYCCYPFSPLTLEVSTDGGTLWTVFPAHGNFVQSANEFSANPLRTVVDISCVAAGESEVILRWAYNSIEFESFNFYFWGLDDIRIYENEVVNDLVIHQVMNGDIWNIWEYRVTPYEQRVLAADGGVLAGIIYSNIGYENQDNVTVLIEVLDDNSNVIHTFETTPFQATAVNNNLTCPGNYQDTLYIETGFEPAAIGEYDLRLTIGGDQTDEDPDNNMMMKHIVFSTDEYGHDDENNLDFQLGSGLTADTQDDPDTYNIFGFGSFYTFNNEGSEMFGVTAQFGSNSDQDTFFESFILQYDNTIGLTASYDQNLMTSHEFYFAEEWENIGPYYLPFDDPQTAEVGVAYFSGLVRNYDDAGRISVLIEADSDTDNSTGNYEYSGANEPVWFTAQTHSPAVRLIVSNRVGIDETQIGVADFNLSPNPASTSTRVNLNLDQASFIAWEIRDVTGKLMAYRNIGQLAQGTSFIDLDVSTLASGNYTVGIVLNGKSRVARHFEVVK